MAAKKTSTSKKRTASRKRNASGGSRSHTKYTSPYLFIGGSLCLLAMVLLVTIVLLASKSEPAAQTDDSTEGSSSVGTVSETVSEAVSQEESTVSEDISNEISIDEGYSLPPDIPDKIEQPKPGPQGPIEQLQSTIDYENEIGQCYAIDMTRYEKYVSPEDPMEYVFLVDPEHPLDKNYKPDDMIWIQDIRAGRPEGWSYMREYAEKALEAFLEEARAYGIDDVTVTNGFRSYNSQVSLFNGYLEEERQRHPDYTEQQIYDLVRTYSALPGTSEHQTGLAVDMHNQRYTNSSFAGTEAALWLEANCYRFGFVLSYPEDKVDITGYIFEPWHFRFVGREVATEMHELDMVLVEYMEYKGLA